VAPDVERILAEAWSRADCLTVYDVIQ
jgi:hypothetical protein